MFWHVESIKKRGIKAIINLMDEFEGPTKVKYKIGVKSILTKLTNFLFP